MHVAGFNEVNHVVIPQGRNRLNEEKSNFNFLLHPNAELDSDLIRFYANWIKEYSVIQVDVIFEIGASYAQAAECLRYHFDASAKDIYVFESNADICAVIPKLYPEFKVFNKAVSNQKSKIKFNTAYEPADNALAPSLLNDYVGSANCGKQVEVECQRL